MNVRIPKNSDRQIGGPESIYAIMQKVLLRENEFRRNKEYFWTVGIDTKNFIQYIELVALGSSNMAVVKPADVFQVAVLKKCEKVILIHNHPTGELTPSQADLDLTKKFINAGKVIEIDIVDHLIISETEYRSIIDDAVLDR